MGIQFHLLESSAQQGNPTRFQGTYANETHSQWSRSRTFSTPKHLNPHPNLDLLINVQQMTNLTKEGRQKFFPWQRKLAEGKLFRQLGQKFCGALE